ncbi:sterol desaturase family protein [Novosphingobium sediminicola]|uniref:Sterol desaturase/sphingolipid hydroxylase (Fatty acid hydroxylase superfamily) n=1 Tax=Novosphingobium sediminicola TaxID=563162 RepID=A0A7W6G6E9_9SPHN|nr:sterol desaturase family protein [Novosphingobium sediminicola]MBB3953892.1 sterol desaturase/sphingolipid hydroxylase (fatty acid hydroxylase superfamily) [Novosphingobium sediminicola]
MKQHLVNLLPPATLVAIVCFWMFGPAAWLANEYTLVWVTSITTAFVLGLEFLFERHEGWRMDWREFATDLFYVILGATVITWVTNVAAEEPLMAAKKALGIATPWAGRLPFLVQVVSVMAIIEFGQYWMHRLMHNSTPFWLTHAPHHHITQLNAMKGSVGNPIELFLISLSVLAFFDFSPTAKFCAISVNAAIAIYAHANVAANPPFFYSFFFTTIRNHSLHHSVPYEDTRCNYGNSLIIFDRIFGTFREGEASVVGQDERKRLSIIEQAVFPFVPLVDAYKARRGEKA